jgi:hypothetical protein
MFIFKYWKNNEDFTSLCFTSNNCNYHLPTPILIFTIGTKLWSKPLLHDFYAIESVEFEATYRFSLTSCFSNPPADLQMLAAVVEVRDFTVPNQKQT